MSSSYKVLRWRSVSFLGRVRQRCNSPSLERSAQEVRCYFSRIPFKVWMSIAQMSYEVLCSAMMINSRAPPEVREGKKCRSAGPPFHSQISSLMLCWSMPFWRPLFPRDLPRVSTMLSHKPAMLPLLMLIYGVGGPFSSVLGVFFLFIRCSSNYCS